MKTLRDLRRHAKKFKADIVVNTNNRECFDVEAFAPSGFHWDEDPHSLVAHTTDTRFKNEVIEELIDRMTGLEPCNPEFCTCIEAGCFDK